MAFGERKKMKDKYRTAVAASVLEYIDTAKQLRKDPLRMARLSTLGSVVLGGELKKSTGRKHGPNDSVWWVVVNPHTGRVSSTKQIAPDLSKWRKSLNKQLTAWGKKSAVKQLAKKRRTRGLVIAAITTAVVIATVVTVGVATGPMAAGAAAAGASGSGAAAAAGGGVSAGTAAAASGGGGTALTGLFKGMQAISAAASAGQGLAGQASAAEAAVPPAQMQMITTEVTAIEAPIYTQPLFWVGVTGVTVLVVGGAMLLAKDK
jgi:hypothetical protein